MEITAGFALTICTIGKIEIGSTEHDTCRKIIFRGIRVDTRNDTQFVLVVHFESKAEIAGPSQCTYQHFTTILRSQLVQRKLEERRGKHIGTGAQFGIDHLFTESQFSFGHVGFVCPVTRKFSQIILSTIQMKHTRGILVKHYGLLLLMADFRIGFNDILGRISDVMQLYRNRIFIISQGDNGFVNSLRHRFRLMRDILQQK